MKIIKIFDGNCEGYTVPAHEVYTNMRDLVKQHGRSRKEKYYVLEEIDYILFEKEIQKEKDKIEKEETEIEKQKLLKQKAEIEKRLYELN